MSLPSDGRCKFDPGEWREYVDIDIEDGDVADEGLVASLECPYAETDNCPLHQSHQSQSVSEFSARFVRHYRQNDNNGSTTPLSNTLTGLTSGGLDLEGQTVSPVTDSTVSLKYGVFDGPVVLTRARLASGFSLTRSVLTNGLSAKESTFNYGLTLSNNYVGGDLRASKSHCRGTLSLSDSTITGDLDLEGARIDGDLDLSGATIGGDISLSDISIEGNLIIEDLDCLADAKVESLIVGEASPSHTGAGGEMILRGGTIEQSLQLKDSSLQKLDLGEAHIKGRLKLESSKIITDINAPLVRVGSGVLVRDVEVGKMLSLSGGNFAGRFQIWSNGDTEENLRSHIPAIKLDQAEFHQEVSIVDCDFDHLSAEGIISRSFVSVRNHSYPGPATAISLHSATLESGIILENIHLRYGFILTDIQSAGHVTIKNCASRRKSLMKDATINNYLSISNSVFCRGISGTHASIRDRIKFESSIINGCVDFSQAKMGGLTSEKVCKIDELQLASSVISGVDLDLSDAVIGNRLSLKDSRVGCDLNLQEAEIYRINISQCKIDGKFSGNDLRDDVSWKRYWKQTSVTEDGHGAGIEHESIDWEQHWDRSGGGDDTSESDVDGGLIGNNCRISGSLNIAGGLLFKISLPEATTGAVDISQTQISEDLNFRESDVSSFECQGVSCQTVNLNGTTIHGDLLVFNTYIYPEDGRAKGFTATFCTCNGDVFQINGSQIATGIDLSNAEFSGDILIADRSAILGEITGREAQIGRHLELDRVHAREDIDFTDANVGEEVTICHSRLESSFVLSDATVGEEFQTSIIERDSDEHPRKVWASKNGHRQCIIGEVDLTKTTFQDEITIDNTRIGADIQIKDAIITEEFESTKTKIGGDIRAKDIRVGSTLNFDQVECCIAGFNESMFKWNVEFCRCDIDSFSLKHATFKSTLKLARNTIGSPWVDMRDVSVEHMVIDWRQKSSDSTGSGDEFREQNPGVNDDVSYRVNLRGATIKEFESNPDRVDIWKRIHVNNTDFRRVEFHEYQSELESINYRIAAIDPPTGTWARARRFASEWRGARCCGLPKPQTEYHDSVQDSDNPSPDTELPPGEHHRQREITYQKAKEGADRVADNPAASQFYRLEKKHRRRRRHWEKWGDGPFGKNLRRQYANLLLGVLTGHGERVRNTLGIIVGVVVGFAIIFAALDGGGVTGIISTATETPVRGVFRTLELLSASVGVFGGLGTNLYENPSGWLQAAINIERIIGAVLIALLVFTFTRALHR